MDIIIAWSALGGFALFVIIVFCFTLPQIIKARKKEREEIRQDMSHLSKLYKETVKINLETEEDVRYWLGRVPRQAIIRGYSGEGQKFLELRADSVLAWLIKKETA